MKKIAACFLLLILIIAILTGCGSYTTAKPGQCMWCDGYGYASYYDVDGNLINIKGRTRYPNYKQLRLSKYMNYFKVGCMDYFQGFSQGTSRC